MSMVCPQCNDGFEQRLSCPTCGVRLHYQSGNGPVSRPSASGRWQQSGLGRIVLGLVLAQGLYYGLCRLYTSFELAFKDQFGLSDTHPAVLMLLQGMQLLTLLLGGLLIGAGHASGEGLGAIFGLLNGLLCVVLQPAPGQGVTTVALYSQPMLQCAVGALAGWIGRAIWKPLPSPFQGDTSNLVRKGGPGRRSNSLFAGQVAWVRVAAGVLVAVVGSLSATLILDMVANVGPVRGGTTPIYPELMYAQDKILTWEIKALAILFGGALAGVNSRNGFKQGLCVGLTTTLVLAGVLASRGQGTLPILAGTVISSFTLGIVGGWFGSQLLPPIIHRRRARGVGAAGAF